MKKLGFLALGGAFFLIAPGVGAMDKAVELANLMSANGNSLSQAILAQSADKLENAEVVEKLRDEYKGMWCNVLTRETDAQNVDIHAKYTALNKLMEIFYDLETEFQKGTADPWTPLLTKAEMRDINTHAGWDHNGAGPLPQVNHIAGTQILDNNFKALPADHAAADYHQTLEKAETVEEIFKALENMNLAGPDGGDQNNLQIVNGGPLSGADADGIFDARLAYCVWLACFMSTGKFMVAAGLPPELGGGNNLVRWKPKNGAEQDIDPVALRSQYNLRALKLIMKWTRAR